MEAKDCNCIECGKQAVAFYPIVDPDIPAHPYCADCLYKAMVSLAEAVWGNDKGMLVMAKYHAEKVKEKYKKMRTIREIKFKALSMCKGERWVYGDLRHYARNPHTEKWTIHDPSTGLESSIDETTVGQFTGLTDKNGVEIYEGDILRLRQPNGNFADCEVKMSSLGYWSITFDIHTNVVLGYIDREQIEVIGNIHEKEKQ